MVPGLSEQSVQSLYCLALNPLWYQSSRYEGVLHGPSMFAVKAKIYGVLYNQASSIPFGETSSYWTALKSS